MSDGTCTLCALDTSCALSSAYFNSELPASIAFSPRLTFPPRLLVRDLPRHSTTLLQLLLLVRGICQLCFLPPAVKSSSCRVICSTCDVISADNVTWSLYMVIAPLCPGLRWIWGTASTELSASVIKPVGAAGAT